MMKVILPHMTHDVKGQHVKSGAFRKLSEDHGALDHVEDHLHILVFVIQNYFGFDPLLEIVVRVHEGSELVNLDLANNHGTDGDDRCTSAHVRNSCDLAKVVASCQLVDHHVVPFVLKLILFGLG
jgi:hypothetical protein